MFLRLKSQHLFWQFCILSAFCFIAFFYGMASYPILDMNEGLYAEIAREMLVTKDYIIPQLNYVPYLEKPPLLYWLITLSYHVFGVSTFAARIIPALSSFATILIILFFGRKTNKTQAGWIAGIIFASSFGFAIIGRVVFFDMLLTTFFTAALCSFYLWYQNEKKIFLYVFYFTLSLAFLTKGMLPVAIAGISILVFMLITKTPKENFFRVFNICGVVLFFVFTAAWYITAAMKLKNFGWDYFINEQVFRFLDKREPHDYHTGPWYFYIPRILVYIFPWCYLIPSIFSRFHGKISEQDPLKIFLYVWFFVALIIFSLSGAKGDYYMVLGMPPLIMLLALKIESYILENKHYLLFIFFCLTAVIIFFGTLYVFIYTKIPAPPLNQLPTLLSFLVVYILTALILIHCYKKPLLTFILTAGLIMPILVFGANFERDMQANYNQTALTNYIKNNDPERPVYLFQDYENVSTVLFNLERRLPIIDSKSRDLYFGSQTEAARGWFLTGKEFLDKKNQPIYVILLKNKLADFYKPVGEKSFHVVEKSDKALVLSN